MPHKQSAHDSKQVCYVQDILLSKVRSQYRSIHRYMDTKSLQHPVSLKQRQLGTGYAVSFDEDPGVSTDSVDDGVDDGMDDGLGMD